VDRAAIEELFAQWETGDFGSGVALYAEDIRFSATQPEGQAEAHGLAELGRFMQGFLAELERYRVELHELEDLGGGRYLGTASQHMTGKASGMELTAPVYVAIAVRDGKIVQLEYHAHSRGDALTALGRTGSDA